MKNYLSAPLEVGIELTNRCNLKCLHCYLNDNSKMDLEYDKVIELIDNFKKLNVFNIFLGGGEPLLHKDFFKFAEYIDSKGIPLLISTNGILLNKKTAKRFSKLKNPLFIQVSLEGPKSIQEKIRGKGSYKKAIDAIKNLQKFKIDPTLGTTINKFNFKYLKEIFEFAHSNKIKYIHFMNMMPSGRGLKNYKLLSLNVYEKIKMLKDLKNLSKKFKNICVDFANPCMQPPIKNFHSSLYSNIDKLFTGCGAGRTRVTITANGDVIGCDVLRISAGNIKQSSFENIWLNSSFFKKLRKRNVNTIKGKCKCCKYLFACIGDCPEYSIAHKKSIFYGGLECPHNPKKRGYLNL